VLEEGEGGKPCARVHVGRDSEAYEVIRGSGCKKKDMKGIREGRRTVRSRSFKDAAYPGDQERAGKYLR